MNPAIIGIGTALPRNSISQADSCSHAIRYCFNDRRAKVLERLYSKTDIESRSLVLVDKNSRTICADFYPPPISESYAGPSTAERMLRYNQDAGPLATLSCRAALDDARIKAQSITHLVTVSCTGFASPGLDLHLLDSLALNPGVSRTNVGFMGCHGAMNGLRAAQSFCLADPTAVVLICATEICSVHFQYGCVLQTLVANSLFADGSAAVVMASAANKPYYSSTASYVVPKSSDVMSWHIGDNGFIMKLSSEAPNLIEKFLPAFMATWLASNQLSIKDIRGWAIHPGGPRILDAVEHSLELDFKSLSISRDVLAECGNMSSPTVIFILQRLLAAGEKLPCVVLAFGPGLTIEAALLR